MSDFNHALNLTHDGALILRIPKGYKVDKVVVEEMGTDNRKEYQPTHPTPSNTLGALDCVDRQVAIDALMAFKEAHKADRFTGDFLHWTGVRAMLENLPSVQHEQELLKDGTLVVKTDFDMTKFDRINVIQNGTHYGDLFYQDDDTRRKGKWVLDNPHSEIYRYACSECHAHHRARYDFCPSCGADMREGEQDAD